MALLHFSTKVPAAKTVGELQAMLGKHGAKRVMTEFDGNGEVKSLIFEVLTPRGNVSIRLPIDPEAVKKALEADSYEVYIQPKWLTYEHAVMVAWRNLHHWVEAQMAFINTGQVRMEQIFMPYVMLSETKCLFDAWMDGKLLPEGREQGDFREDVG